MKYLPALLCISLLPGAISCNNETDVFTIGDELVNVSTDVISSDSFTVRSSTILIDSFVTSGTGKMLVGRYTDGDLGTTTASGYFELNAPSYSAPASDAIYDSITLNLSYSNYAYGDTTNFLTIEVHELSEKLSDNPNDDGYRYCNSKVSYNTALLGSKTFRPRPSNTAQVEIKLTADLGLELFNLIKDNDDAVSSYAEFTEYFKGIALTPGPLTSSIVGFTCDTSLRMRLHYHEGTDVKYINFEMSYSSLQFNRIETDRSSSPLGVLKKREDILSSAATNHQTYCQTGTGINTRLEFPYLRQLVREDDNIKVLKAELILCPVKNTYKTISLPENLILYYLDDINQAGNVLTSSEGSSLLPSLTIDDIYNEQTQYVFDITTYVQSVLEEETEEIPALALAIEEYNTSVDRVILGDQLKNPNVAKLKIMYWKY